MGFKFRFETLSRVRKIKEDMALQEFSKAQKRLLDIQGLKALKIAQRATSIGELEQRMDRGIPAREVGSYHTYITHLEEVIEKIESLLAQAAKHVEEKREALLKAKQEHNAIERLKEIDLARYRAEESRQEMLFIDEIAIQRHGRSQ